jgi:hypothetical protein
MRRITTFLAALILLSSFAVTTRAEAPHLKIRAVGDVVQNFAESFDEDGNSTSGITIATSALTAGNTVFLWSLYISNIGTTSAPTMTGVTFTQVSGFPRTGAAVGSCTGGNTCEVSLWRGVVNSGGATSLSHTVSYGNDVFIEVEGSITIYDDSAGTNTASSALDSGAATSDEAGKAFGFYFGIDAVTSSGGFTSIIENCDTTIAYCVGVADRTTVAATSYSYTSSNSLAGWNAYVFVANTGEAPPTDDGRGMIDDVITHSSTGRTASQDDGPPLPPADEAPGGFFVERTALSVRNQDNILLDLSFLPASNGVGEFTFPAPYNTIGYRLTNLLKCGNVLQPDCVRQSGYSDWQNIFSEGPPGTTPDDYVCFWQSFGDYEPIQKGCLTISTGAINWAPIFEVGDDLRAVNSASDGWQASPTEANILYLRKGTKYLRCNTGNNLDVLNVAGLDSDDVNDCSVVGDINSPAARTVLAAEFGGVAADYLDNHFIWTPHVATNSGVIKFSAIVRQDFDPYADIGTIVLTAPDTWKAYPSQGDPYLDLSGRYVGYAVVDASCAGSGNDFLIIDTNDDSEHLICNESGTGLPSPGGAPGHLAFGYGYALFSDDAASSSGGAGFEQVKIWDLANVAAGGTLATSYPVQFDGDSMGQPAWGASRPTSEISLANQQICNFNTSGDVPDPAIPRERELYCYNFGSSQVLIIAPGLTSRTASGTGGGETNAYYRSPKPNVSSDGDWYYLVANAGTSRMDAYLVWIPNHLLAGG